MIIMYHAKTPNRRHMQATVPFARLDCRYTSNLEGANCKAVQLLPKPWLCGHTAGLRVPMMNGMTTGRLSIGILMDHSQSRRLVFAIPVGSAPYS